MCVCCFFFFNDTATTEIYTLSLHDALPIFGAPGRRRHRQPALAEHLLARPAEDALRGRVPQPDARVERSEEHTSELQSRQYLVCRLLLEKKKHNIQITPYTIHITQSLLQTS